MHPTSLSLRGFSVHITAEGDVLETYGIAAVGARTSCSIASAVGKAFEIHIEMHNAHVFGAAAACWVYVDGVKVGGRILGWDATGKCRATGSIVGARVNSDSVKKLYFAQLALSEDEADRTHGPEELAEMGQIRVEIHLVRTMGPSFEHIIESAMLPHFVVAHEKEKKLGGHHARLGEAIHAPSNKHNVQLLNDRREPYATFEFRYCSLDVLQAQGVAPLFRDSSRLSRTKKRKLIESAAPYTKRRKLDANDCDQNLAGDCDGEQSAVTHIKPEYDIIDLTKDD